MKIDLKLPYLTQDMPGIGGKIREKPENFLVEEISLYQPSGMGEHLYINITKKSMNTKDVSEIIAKTLKIDKRDIGFAGMKDRHAITTQTFSVKTEETEGLKEKLESYGNLKVNWMKFHKNKLRVGHLLSNKFKILITGIELSSDETIERTERIIDKIKKRGIPNFFGPQRFGIDGKNVGKGLDIIKGRFKVNKKWMRRLMVSSYQSYLCNKYLSYRLKKGLFDKILLGDVAKKYETGGLFQVEDQEIDQERYESHEISFTAPIYGYKMWDTEGPSAELEKEVLSQSEITMEELLKAKIKGTRRLGRLLVPDIYYEIIKKDLFLTFSLRKGAFATNVLREIMKNKRGF